MTISNEIHVKKLYFSQKDRSISKDSFIFSAWEEIENIRHSHLDLPLKESTDLKTFLSDFFATLIKEYPSLQSKKIHNYEKHGHFLPGFGIFMMNIEKFFEKTAKKKIPKIEHLDHPEQTEFWDVFWPEIDELFLESAPLVKAYLLWKYRQPRIEKISLSLLPPVGRFIPLLRRSKS